MLTVHELIASLRDGPYADGGYPKYWLTSDGGTFSFDAVTEDLGRFARSTRDRLSDGWAIEAVDINWEDPELYCDQTGARIPSAYAEDERADD